MFSLFADDSASTLKDQKHPVSRDPSYDRNRLEYRSERVQKGFASGPENFGKLGPSKQPLEEGSHRDGGADVCHGGAVGHHLPDDAVVSQQQHRGGHKLARASGRKDDTNAPRLQGLEEAPQDPFHPIALQHFYEGGGRNHGLGYKLCIKHDSCPR